MPKFTEEMEDKIVVLIEQGLKNAQISRELGVYRGAVATRRKEHEKRNRVQEQPLDPQKYTPVHIDGEALSDGAMRRLYQIHELLGANNMDEMVEAIYADQLAADKYRGEYVEFMKENCPEAEAPKTFAEIIAEEKGYARDLKYDLDIYMEGYREDRELKDELKAEAERKYDEGYQKGKNDYALLIPCTRCGKPCTIAPGTESHWLIVDFCREQGIAHDDCIPRFKRIFVP